ncbi:MAG: cytochrome P450 [Chloroflexota bacterium]
MATTTVPAGPRGNVLLGNLPAMQRDALGSMTDWARRYGDFVPVRFGPYAGYFVNHPDYIEQMLVANARHYVKGSVLQRSRYLLGNGLLTAEGDFWLRQRRLIAPAFHRERLATYAETMTSYTERMLADWSDGEERDLHPEMTRLTLAIVAKTLFDADVARDAPQVGQAMGEVMHAFATRSAAAVFLPQWVPLPSRRRAWAAAARLDRIIYRFIAERRTRGGARDDLLSLLLSARDENGEGMPDKQVRDEAMTIFLAGHETTAIALTWAFALLAQQPAAEARLAAELEEALDGRAPGLADLPNLPYTEAVVWEALRLYPPAYAIERLATRDTEIGPYHVPKGSTVIASQWVMQRDARYFAAPDEFRPERWLDGLAKQLPKFAYFPFGGGPRVCIGNQFALMEARLLLAGIARRFRLELAPGQRLATAPSITLRPRYGLRVLPRRRPSKSASGNQAA